MIDLESYVILMATFSCAFVILGYESHARMKGWSVGAWFIFGSAVHLISGLVALSILGESFYLFSWWTPIAVLAGGFITAFILSNLFKEKVQFVSIVGMVVGWILSIDLM